MIEGQIAQQEAQLTEKLNSRIDASLPEVEENSETNVESLLTSNTPLTTKQAASCAAAFRAQLKTQVTNYYSSQQAQQQELISSQRMHRQRFEYLIQSYQTLVASLSSELQKMRVLNRESFDYNLYLNTLITMHPEVKNLEVDPVPPATELVIPENAESHTKTLLKAQHATKRLRDQLSVSRDSINVVKEYLAAVAASKKAHKRKAVRKEPKEPKPPKENKESKPRGRRRMLFCVKYFNLSEK